MNAPRERGVKNPENSHGWTAEVRAEGRRSEPVLALLGIGPDPLPPLCCRPVLQQGCPTPPVETILQAAAAAVAEAGKASGLPTRSHPDVTFPPHLCPSPCWEPWWPPHPAPPSRQLCCQKMHKAPSRLQVLGEVSPCPQNTTDAHSQPPPGQHGQNPSFSAAVTQRAGHQGKAAP